MTWPGNPENPRLRRELLADIHADATPRGYVEIGVDLGKSLRLAKCPALGIDPRPRCGAPPTADIFTGTSDEFFAAGAPLGKVEGTPIDLIYIDGLHTAEQSLRDFANCEHFLAHTGTVIMLDDVLPRRPEAGNVWHTVLVLARHRPDLEIQIHDVMPTGLALVWGLDPDKGLDWVGECSTF